MGTKPGEWAVKAPLSAPRSHPAVAVYNGEDLLFRRRRPRLQKPQPLRSLRSQNRPVVLAPSDADAPLRRDGGDDRRRNLCDRRRVQKPDGKFKFLTTVELYFPKEDRWETGPDLLQPHDYPASTILDGKIYIIGGHHPNATEGGPQTDPAFSFSERWSPGMKGWEEIAPMPTPRFAASAVVTHGQLWALGGVAFTPQGFNEYDRIEIFDPKMGKWTVNSLKLPWGSAGQGACVVNGRLYIFGGFRGDEGIGTHGAVYDSTSKKWSELPPMPEARAAMGIAVIDGTIYLLGGWAKDRSVMGSVVAF
ncbi:MAG: hypothetical protein MPW14_02050 [Candidatus Manganitrophus sp.]|nr:MAG: hypothetical protein MPW14_02050 [Candidatus Manganitrophus sp.]